MPDGSDTRPAVFFDRDNTLMVASEYVGDPKDVVLVNDAAEAVTGVRHMGFATVVISNQSGVARGFFTEKDVRAVNRRLDELLKARDRRAVIDRHEFCPHHPTHGIAPYRQACQCRKPRDGMLRRAASALGLDLGKSWLIGDAPRDIEAGRSAGTRTILLSPPDLEPSEAAHSVSQVKPDFQVSSLREALWVIAKETGHQLPVMTAEQAELDELDRLPQQGDLEGEDDAILLADAHDDSISAQSSAPERPQDTGAAGASESGIDSHVPPASAQHRGYSASGPMQRAASSVASKSAAMRQPAVAADEAAPTTAQILDELRRQRETAREDFNFLRLLASIVQVVALAAVVWGIVLEFDQPRLLLAVFLQLLTLTFLIASR